MPVPQEAEPTATQRIKEMLRSASFFAYWWLGFRVRLHIAPWLPVLFSVLSGIEILTLLFEGLEKVFEAEHVAGEISNVPAFFIWIDHRVHQGIDYLHVSSTGLITFAIASALLSIILGAFTVWHHHRVSERVTQYLGLLSAMRLITVETFSNRSHGVDHTIDNALKLLTDALLNIKTKRKDSITQRPSLAAAKTLRKGILVRDAAILRLRPGQTSFEIFHQYPARTYQVKLGLHLDSAAGRALQRPPQTDFRGTHFKGIIYIPWTRCPHGARLWIDESKVPHYRRMDFEKEAYFRLKSIVGLEPKSLICLEIPVFAENPNRYVLCLDSSRWQCFDEVDFQAAHLMANVLSVVIDWNPRA